MPAVPAPKPRQTEARIKRTIRAALDAGLAIGAVEVAPDGTIRLLRATGDVAQSEQRTPEEW